MQYLKEEVRNRIRAAALEEFSAKGYMDASMRNIAKEANVSLGNLYRYFKNKEQLFDDLVEPLYKVFQTLDNINDPEKELHTIDGLERTTDEYIRIVIRNRKQFLILLDKSQGTKYQGTKEELINKIEKILRVGLLPELMRKGITIEDEYILSVMAFTVLEGTLAIIRKYTDEAQMRYLVSQLIIIYFCDIANRFK